jgi:hypothetical protein
MLFEQHTRGLFNPKELTSSLRSSNSPSPLRRSEVKQVSLYLPPVCELSVKEKTNVETLEESNAYQDPREMTVSPPASSSETSRSSFQAHTSTPTTTSASTTSNRDPKLELFNKWLQRIDNPVDTS